MEPLCSKTKAKQKQTIQGQGLAWEAQGSAETIYVGLEEGVFL